MLKAIIFVSEISLTNRLY